MCAHRQEGTKAFRSVGGGNTYQAHTHTPSGGSTFCRNFAYATPPVFSPPFFVFCLFVFLVLLFWCHLFNFLRFVFATKPMPPFHMDVPIPYFRTQLCCIPFARPTHCSRTKPRARTSQHGALSPIPSHLPRHVDSTRAPVARTTVQSTCSPAASGISLGVLAYANFTGTPLDLHHF